MSKSNSIIDFSNMSKEDSKSFSSRQFPENPNRAFNVNEKDRVERVEKDNLQFEIDNVNFNNFSKINQQGNTFYNSKINETMPNTTKENLLNRTEKNLISQLKKNPNKIEGHKSKQPSQIPITPDTCNLNDIVIEKLEESKIAQDNTKDELAFLDEIIQKEHDCYLNDYDISDYFRRIKIEEFNTAFYTFISIASGLIYHELNTNGPTYPHIQKISNYLTSQST
jgi:hypothetical protein